MIKDVKSTDLGLQGQAWRRAYVLQRQQQAASNRLAQARARRLAELEQCQPTVPPKGAERVAEDSKEGKKTNWRAKIAKEQELFYAETLQVPEWLISVPHSLSDWVVAAKPAGARCLVISSNGKTISRNKNGKVMHQFQSLLPNGSRQTRSQKDAHSILECIFNEANQTFFVVDILCWKGQHLYTTGASFRFFWLHSRLGEISGLSTLHSSENEFRFLPVNFTECGLTGLQNAYCGPAGFERDGLLFYQKDGHYWSGRLTPLVLIWKDWASSKYPVDSPDGKNPYPEQMCVLQADKEDCKVLRALAGDAVAVKMELESVPLGPGELGRFVVVGSVQTAEGASALPLVMQDEDGDEEEHTMPQQIVVDGLRFHEKVKGRGKPDSSCRITFQYLMRHAPVTIEHIKQAVEQKSDMDLSS